MIHFEEEDRQKWLKFLNTPAGAKGIAFIREQKKPVIRMAGAPHEMQADLGAQKGFNDAIDEIEKLARIPRDIDMRTADLPPLESTRRV